MVIFFVDKLWDRDKFIAFVLQCGDESIQRVFGIFGTVMAEDNAAVAQVGIFGDPFDDIISAVILPVERIHIPLYGVVMIGTGIFYYIIVIEMCIRDRINISGYGDGNEMQVPTPGVYEQVITCLLYTSSDRYLIGAHRLQVALPGVMRRES